MHFMTITSLISKSPAASRTSPSAIEPPVFGIGTVLWLFGVLSFVAAVLGINWFWINHQPLALIVAVAGVILGCLLLAIVRIIDSLHEIACRLKNIEDKLAK